MINISLCYVLIIVVFFTILCCIYLTDYFHECVIGCDENDKMCKYITYDINGEYKKQHMKKPCILNGWNISHIILFMILSVYFPNERIFLILCGILWEIAEYFFKHENWLDIVWNILGIFLGILISR
jgi:hypothetical protein